MTVTIAAGPAGAADSAAVVETAGAFAALSWVPHAPTSASEVTSRQLGRRRMEGSCGMVSDLRLRVQARLEDLGVEAARVEGAPALGAGQPDLRRAEEQAVDLVEIAFVALEDVVEGCPVVARCG